MCGCFQTDFIGKIVKLLVSKIILTSVNLYLGYTPAKGAEPIRLVMNLRVPLRLVQRV